MKIGSKHWKSIGVLSAVLVVLGLFLSFLREMNQPPSMKFASPAENPANRATRYANLHPTAWTIRLRLELPLALFIAVIFFLATFYAVNLMPLALNQALGTKRELFPITHPYLVMSLMVFAFGEMALTTGWALRRLPARMVLQSFWGMLILLAGGLGYLSFGSRFGFSTWPGAVFGPVLVVGFGLLVVDRVPNCRDPRDPCTTIDAMRRALL